MKSRNPVWLAAACSAGLSVALSSFAAEDDSAAFKANNEALGAAMGLAAPEATVTSDSAGRMSAVVGLSAMKMLMVRQNDDGSVSLGHVASEKEADQFLAAPGHVHGPAEE